MLRRSRCLQIFLQIPVGLRLRAVTSTVPLVAHRRKVLPGNIYRLYSFSIKPQLNFTTVYCVPVIILYFQTVPVELVGCSTPPILSVSFFSLISLIADGPHHYHPACGHKGSSHLSPLHALQFFIAMQVQHSYSSSTTGLTTLLVLCRRTLGRCYCCFSHSADWLPTRKNYTTRWPIPLVAC